MIATLRDFHLGASSPYGKDNNKYYIQMGSRLFSPKLHQAIHLISVVLRSCHTSASVKRFNYHQGITTDVKTKPEIRAQLLKLPQQSSLILKFSFNGHNPEIFDMQCHLNTYN